MRKRFEIDIDHLFENEKLRQELQKWEEYVNELAKTENDNLQKDYLSFEKYNSLLDENEKLKDKLQSVTMLKDDYEELIESFEKKYGKTIEDVVDNE